MNPEILKKEVQIFINSNLNSDITQLLFKGSPFDDISMQELVEQIEAKKRSKKKLLTWFQSANIYYPNKLNIEQTSSEITADYKANLISGTSLIDLTGGFGVDTYYFAKNFKEVIHCETSSELSKIANHNFELLQRTNIKTKNADGLAYLFSSNKSFDWIYVDPSRRDDHKGKVFLLEDCTPNIPANLSALFEHSSNILLKVSPLLDIANTVQILKFVKEVHVVAVNNEVKELLFILQKEYGAAISIKTVNLKKNEREDFGAVFNTHVNPTIALPLSYLYEPNVAILKSGLFSEVSNKLNVFKIHKNSHLYTSEKLISFPGRRFKIIHNCKYNKKLLLQLIPSKKVNITTRNFPESVAQIRKKTNFKEGGEQYAFFTTDMNDNKIVLICKKA